jgi:hypothetical protein
MDRRRLTTFAAISGAAAVLLAMLAMFAPQAHAEEITPYCGGANLSEHSVCTGADRYFYKLSGWGESHSVCVYADNYLYYNNESWRGFGCSSGPGATVYVTLNEQVYAHPAIEDNAAGATRVQGYAYTH